MAAVTIKHFDVLAYVKKAKELGINEEMAEYQARQMEILADTIQLQQQEIEALRQYEPLTHKDLEIVKIELQKEIIASRNTIILWTGAILFASGLIQHFFK